MQTLAITEYCSEILNQAMHHMRLVLCPASSHRTPFVVSVFLTSTEACHAAHLTDATHIPLEVKWISKRLLVSR